MAAAGHANGIQGLDFLVRDVAWPVADLRCDWSEDCPIGALTNLWTLYKPQLDNYVLRALDPLAAPSYGVPGDQ